MYLSCSESKHLHTINFRHASCLLNAKRLMAAACRTGALTWILSAGGRWDLGTKSQYKIRSLLIPGFQHSQLVIWVFIMKCPFFFTAYIHSFRELGGWVPELREDKLDTQFYLMKWKCSGWSLGPDSIPGGSVEHSRSTEVAPHSHCIPVLLFSPFHLHRDWGCFNCPRVKVDQGKAAWSHSGTDLYPNTLKSKDSEGMQILGKRAAHFPILAPSWGEIICFTE